MPGSTTTLKYTHKMEIRSRCLLSSSEVQRDGHLYFQQKCKSMVDDTNSFNRSIIDQKKLGKFMEWVMSDLGGTYSSVLVYIGDKLGLYKAMKDA